MARVLKSEYRTTSSVLTLHDRPPAHFQPLTPPQQSAFLHHLPESAPYAASIDEGKTHLIVSSTSWTADEDFSILLDALLKYSARARPRPYLVVIITGKGPQKEAYVSQIARLTSSHRLENVTILTAWLSIENYASLLASASLGVSLHMSSSGVDLPMKVVDMFGAGLPVAGWAKFKAWPELVQEGVNGRGFDSADGLADILEELLVGDKRNLAVLKQGAIREGEVRWDDEWNGVAGRLLGLCE
ncbi:MAG: mannosyltransferase [Vezdaea acicularis]|nr:MAG: mannosyltransferase [Vezdaea acicularis]